VLPGETHPTKARTTNERGGPSILVLSMADSLNRGVGCCRIPPRLIPLLGGCNTRVPLRAADGQPPEDFSESHSRLRRRRRASRVGRYVHAASPSSRTTLAKNCQPLIRRNIVQVRQIMDPTVVIVAIMVSRPSSSGPNLGEEYYANEGSFVSHDASNALRAVRMSARAVLGVDGITTAG
jgi:hypothetical protein